MARLVLHVVPHTHWDREWYEPFETYRFRLVGVLDRLLEIMRTDPGFSHFNFDGQTAAIEDYLDVRPEAGTEIAALVREGRLAIGPWRILMDEFLCSAETIVRNLQQGATTASALGRAMRLGYIPDSFGHIAQMPQLLRLAGLTDACVWRGVPSAVDRTVFRWEAPDGSAVRTVYMPRGYSNAVALPTSPEELLARAARIAADLEPLRGAEAILAMNGSDHQGAQAHLPELFAKTNAMQDEVSFRLGSLQEYIETLPDADLPVWRGEMRSGARANLLPGVASARVPLKLAELRASIELERYAEPLALLGATSPGTLLDGAWRRMVENSAHDSICGCGIDAVADQVAERYREAFHIAALIAADGLGMLAARVEGPPGAALVFNPSPRARSAVTEVTVTTSVDPGRLAFRTPDGEVVPAQTLWSRAETLIDMRLRGDQLAAIVPTINSRLMERHVVNDVSIEHGSDTTVRLSMGAEAEGDLDVQAVKAAVEAAIAARPRARFRVLGTGPFTVRALVQTPSVGGLGWTVLEPVGTDPAPPGVRADGHVLDNGLIRAEVDAAGQLALTRGGFRYEGLLAIEDGGDAGDEYNYSPPERDVVVTDPVEPAVVDEVLHGPLEAGLRVTTRYRIPASLDTRGTRRARRSTYLPVVATYTLRAGEPFLRARLEVVNDARDHRVRALFPLPFAVSGSNADTAFHVTARTLEAEGGVHEHGLATFPSRRWVDTSDGDNGLAILHRGTPEYEIAGGRAIAVTLLRSVGWLSRQGMAYRAGPAGPAIPTPGAQLPGTHAFDLAVYPHAGDWRGGDVHAAWEAFALPLRAAPVRGGMLTPRGSALSIEPHTIELSALHAAADGVTCRIYNASDEEVIARARFGEPLRFARARLVGILGDERGAVARDGEAFVVPLRPWEIATLSLT